MWYWYDHLIKVQHFNKSLLSTAQQDCCFGATLAQDCGSWPVMCQVVKVHLKQSVENRQAWLAQVGGVQRFKHPWYPPKPCPWWRLPLEWHSYGTPPSYGFSWCNPPLLVDILHAHSHDEIMKAIVIDRCDSPGLLWTIVNRSFWVSSATINHHPNHSR